MLQFDRWRNLFSSTMITRGKDYYRAGRVKKIVPEENGFRITVTGTHSYQVTIQANGMEIVDVDCTCPFAEKGYFCKHEAAAFFKLEEMRKGALPGTSAFEEKKEESAEKKQEQKETVVPEKKKRGRPRKDSVVDDQQQKQESTQIHEEDPGKKLKEVQSEKKHEEFKEQATQEPEKNFQNVTGIPVSNGLSALSELELLAKQQRQQREQDGKADEARTPDWDNYSYFHPERFREELKLDEKTQNLARELIRKGKITLKKVETNYYHSTQVWGEGELAGVVEASVQLPRENDALVRMFFGRTRLQSSTCYSWECRQRTWYQYDSNMGHRLCEHEVATLFLLEDYLKTHPIGDATNMEGASLMERIILSKGMNVTREQQKKAQLLTLTPVADLTDETELKVGFRVGSSKSYKVKDLRPFLSNVRYHQEMQFGTKTKLQLGNEFFDEASLSWLGFVEDALREEDQRNQRRRPSTSYWGSSYMISEPPIKDTVPLYGSKLDQFYQLMPASGVECVVHSRRDKQTIVLSPDEEEMKLKLEIRGEWAAETGLFDGIRIRGTFPTMIAGQQASYLITGSKLKRVGQEQIKRMRPLLGASVNGKVDLLIGRLHLADFYYKTLPVLKEMAEVSEPDFEKIAPYLPGQPTFFIYLDVEEGLVLAKADVAYSGKEFSLLDSPWLAGGEHPGASYRDFAREKEVLEKLLQYVKTWVPERDLLCSEKDDEDIFLLLAYGLDELLEMAEVHMTERFRRLGLRRHIKFDLGVALESNLLDLSVSSDELSQEELLEVLYSYSRKKRFVRLKNGDFLKLDESETLGQLAQLMETLHLTPKQFVAGKMHVPAYRALYLDKMLEQMQDVYTDRDRYFKQLIKNFKTVEDADYEIPASLRGVMRKYQEAGYRWLRMLDEYGFGGILADEMGLGKTLQVIAVLLAAKKEVTDSAPSLVVCPASLVYNWTEELRRFAPELSVCMVVGTKTERNAVLSEYQRYDVLVTSYDLLKRDIDLYEGKEFRFEVIDEAQYIKNQQTSAAKAVKLVKSRTRYALTGTPIENRLSELWSIFDYLMPGFLYEYGTFRAEFETPIVKYQQEEANERLRRMVGPFLLRRRKEDVLKDLPEKLEEVRYAGMEEKQRRLYDGQVVKMRKSVAQTSEEDFRRSRIQILAELTRIRQICCDPSLFLEDYDGESAKKESCMELIRSVVEGGHKALLFSQFTSMLDLLKQELDKEKIPYYVITGATPKEQRLELVKAFNSDETPLFLISLKAGGTGLNLVGADVVIHYDPWWNLAVQNQATDRAHRIGQTRPVTVYKLIVKNTIEEKILEMQEAKKKLAEDILSAESAGSATFSRDELLALLEG